MNSTFFLFLALVGPVHAGHVVAPAWPHMVSIPGMILGQTPDPKLPEPPTPPGALEDSKRKSPPSHPLEPEARQKELAEDLKELAAEAPHHVNVTVDHAVRLLDVLHQKDEFKLRELEEGGEVIIYGEDGQPISIADARSGRSYVNINKQRGRGNGRLGVAVFALLFVGYLILRGNTGRVPSR